MLDILEIVKKAEKDKTGGENRRLAMERLVKYSRSRNCVIRLGGGQQGGINIRYGSIGYYVLDVNTKGIVKLYVTAHPSKDAPEEYIKELNEFIEQHPSLKAKTFPITAHGSLEDKVEDIEPGVLELFLDKAVDMILRYYYAPHFEDNERGYLELKSEAPDTFN